MSKMDTTHRILPDGSSADTNISSLSGILPTTTMAMSYRTPTGASFLTTAATTPGGLPNVSSILTMNPHDLGTVPGGSMSSSNIILTANQAEVAVGYSMLSTIPGPTSYGPITDTDNMAANMCISNTRAMPSLSNTGAMHCVSNTKALPCVSNTEAMPSLLNTNAIPTSSNAGAMPDASNTGSGIFMKQAGPLCDRPITGDGTLPIVCGTMPYPPTHYNILTGTTGTSNESITAQTTAVSFPTSETMSDASSYVLNTMILPTTLGKVPDGSIADSNVEMTSTGKLYDNGSVCNSNNVTDSMGTTPETSNIDHNILMTHTGRSYDRPGMTSNTLSTLEGTMPNQPTVENVPVANAQTLPDGSTTALNNLQTIPRTPSQGSTTDADILTSDSGIGLPNSATVLPTIPDMPDASTTGSGILTSDTRTRNVGLTDYSTMTRSGPVPVQSSIDANMLRRLAFLEAENAQMRKDMAILRGKLQMITNAVRDKGMTSIDSIIVKMLNECNEQNGNVDALLAEDIKTELSDDSVHESPESIADKGLNIKACYDEHGNILPLGAMSGVECLDDSDHSEGEEVEEVEEVEADTDDSGDQHSSTEHSSGDSPTQEVYECNNCGKSCGTSAVLETHDCSEYQGERKKDHDTIKPRRRIQHRRKLRFRRTEYPHNCDICGATFLLTHHLKQHIKQVHSDNHNYVDCKICGKFLSKSSVRIHMQSQHGEKFVCFFCDEKFLKRRDLKKHIVVAHEGGFSCSICGKKFGMRKERLNHHMWRHTGVKSFPCKQCNGAFSSAAMLRRHKQVVHDGIPWKKSFCETCGKHYSSSVGEHKKLHIAKAEKCLVCGNMYRFKSTLREHMITHTNDKPFSCEMCGMSFRWKSGFKKHQRLHTGEVVVKAFNCSVCEYSCATNSALKRHMVTHSDARPFRCEVCGQAFKIKPVLDRHKLIHTGEKPYRCELCGDRFRQKPHLKTHEKLVHKKTAQTGITGITGMQAMY